METRRGGRGAGRTRTAFGARGSTGGNGSVPVRNILMAEVIRPAWMAKRPARFVSM